MDYGLIAIKLSTGFLGLWFMTRLLGKKEIAQLTPFDFVSSLMLSELVGNTIYQSDIHYSELLFGLGLWALLSYLFEKLTQHVRRLLKRSDYDTVQRQDLDLPEKPAHLSHSLVQDGRIDTDNLKRIGKDEVWLAEKLAEMGYPKPREVAYAEWNEGEGMYALDYHKKDRRGQQ